MKELTKLNLLPAWAAYDFGSTAYSTLIITIFLPILVKDVLGGTPLHLGLANTLSLILAALIVPITGAISDRSGRRVPWLFLGTLAAALFIIPAPWFDNLFLALIFAGLANFAYHVGIDIYDTLLADLAPAEERGHWSGWGTAVGYIGSLLGIIMGSLITKSPLDQIDQIKFGLTIGAIFLLILVLPLVWSCRERPVPWISKQFLRPALSSVLQTWKNFPRSGNVGRFLLATLLFNDALHTVIIFFYFFAREELQLSLPIFFLSYGVITTMAMVGSIGGGYLADRRGPYKVLLFSLTAWIIIALVLGFSPIAKTFFILGPIAGLMWGSLVAASRPYLAQITNQKQWGELFGFQGLTEKFGGIIGPLIFGLIATRYGYGWAVGSLSIFFLLATILLRMNTQNLVSEIRTLKSEP